MRIILTLILLVIAALPAQAINPSDLSVEWEADGTPYIRQSDGRWELMIDCQLYNNDTPIYRVRRYPIRWSGVIDQSEINALCQQMADNYLKSAQYQALDWAPRIQRATQAIVEDIERSVSLLVETIAEMEDPTVGEMANAWRLIAGELSWIVTPDQADALLNRIADEFGMSGVGVLNYIKANTAWME